MVQSHISVNKAVTSRDKCNSCLLKRALVISNNLNGPLPKRTHYLHDFPAPEYQLNDDHL